MTGCNREREEISRRKREREEQRSHLESDDERMNRLKGRGQRENALSLLMKGYRAAATEKKTSAKAGWGVLMANARSCASFLRSAESPYKSVRTFSV